MKKCALFCLFFFVPVIATPAMQIFDSAEMWWCSSCGLAYPASQKVCLNKDCSLFRKKQ